jgi:FKBP-type peptidyl-prolyl cis-trans isomerase
MKKSIFFLPVLIIAIAIFSSCGDNNNLGKLRQQELEKLDTYIQSNYPNIDPKPSGLYYIELQAGSGDSIQVGDKVQIFYSTWTIDSTLIDQTSGYLLGQRYEPYEFTVGAGNAIQGLEEAATYMQQGTKANLVIPSELAYGQNGTYGVSGFTTLLMQVEVYKIYPAGQ